LAGNDFLAITVNLNNLQQFLVSIKQLIHRFQQMGEHKAPIAPVSASPTVSNITDVLSLQEAQDWPQLVSHVAMNVAKDHNKLVHVDFAKLNAHLIPHALVSTVKDIMIQFVRNSVVHGIEIKERRQLMGKPSVGEINIGCELVNKDLILSIKDDGHGIDVKAITRKLAQSGQYTRAELLNMNNSTKISQIFNARFTTKAVADKHAGRGVGLDLVRQELKNIGASIKVKSKMGQYTEFQMTISQANMTKFA
jgi:two-component system, chemotaxis family, sensor kinase CheA